MGKHKNGNGKPQASPPTPTPTTGTTTPPPPPSPPTKIHSRRWFLSLTVLISCVVVGGVAIMWGTTTQSGKATMGFAKKVVDKLPKYISKRKPFVPPKHANGVKVVDYARHDLPPVTMGERVIDLMSGTHFDNLLQDTPDEMRPPSVILFTGFETCEDMDKKFKYKSTAETLLPSRERLLIATYDMDANPKRAWYKFTPEMDLARRFGVKKCGELVYAPRACNGFTIWCEKKTDDPLVTKAGCENYLDPCAPLIKKYDPARDGPDWVTWLNKLVLAEGEPQISPVLGTYTDQARWIMERDEVTTDNEVRNYYLVEAFPAFTDSGYLMVPTPPELKSWIMDFWNRRKAQRTHESWHSASTQMSFHEKPTTFVTMDQEGMMRDKIANEVIKPIVEKWSGMKPLELTSFYGVREYHDGHWLRNHIDRIDTHVLSVTFTLGKFNLSNPNQLLTPEQVAALPAWPLEVVAFDGEVHRHAHLPDQMILYESSKLPHGRPYRNIGPGHLGAFVHFKPVLTVEEAGKWDDICNFARDHQQINVQRGQYRSTPIKEPEHPKFTPLRYADMTGFESSEHRSKKAARSGAAKQQHSIAIAIVNESDHKLEVAWVHPETKAYHNVGTAYPGTSLNLESFLGHKFQFLEVGGVNKAKGSDSMFEVTAGVKKYVYKGL